MIPSIKNIRTKILRYRARRFKKAGQYGINLKIVLKIPSAFVTGSVGKTTTCRMLAAILADNGKVVGLSTTQGVYIGKEMVRSGDSSSCQYATALLTDKRVDVGVFELARGGIITDGIAFDGCDVGALLNVYDNHLGLNGVNTREEMALVKSVVLRSARKMAVINADDPLCLAMRPQIVARNTCLVSMHSDNASVIDHMQAGGFAAFLSSDINPAITLYKGSELIGALEATEIPAAYDGHFRPALFNAMFAMALAYGMGVEFRIIRKALCAFQSNEETNPGRMNFFEHLPYKVLITGADGPQSLKELALFIQSMNISGDKYLMFCSVGNRPDSYIKAMGKSVAGVFTHYVCSDHSKLRGRPPGASAGLLYEGLIEGGVDRKNITIASSHQDALDIALNAPSINDLLVISTFAYNDAKGLLLRKGKTTNIVDGMGIMAEELERRENEKQR